MKTLLINLPSPNHRQYTYPLGLNRIKTIVEKYGYSTHVIDRQYQELYFSEEYDFIAISAHLESQNELLAILDIIPSYLEDRKIIIGGNLVANNYEMLLEKHPNLILCTGEGERTMDDFIWYINWNLELKEISGIAYFDGKIHHTKGIKADLSKSVPLNIESFSDTIKHDGDIIIETSRGCAWGHCTYCFKEPSRQLKFEVIDNATVIEDIESLVKAGIREISISDPCALAGASEYSKKAKQKMRDLCNLILQKGLDIQIAFSLRADDVYKENSSVTDNLIRIQTLETMKLAGFNLPFLGIESFSDSQLRRYGKGVNGRENIEAIKSVRKIWKEFSIGFIMFDAFVTPKEVMDSIIQVEELDLYDAISYPLNKLKIQRNTPYFKMCERAGLITGYDKNRLLYLTKYQNEDIQEIVNTINMLERETGSILYLAKLRARTNRMTDTDVGDRILHKLHIEHNKIQIQLVKDLINKNPVAIEKFRTKRDELIMILKSNVDNNVINDVDGIFENEINIYYERIGVIPYKTQKVISDFSYRK